MKPISRRHRHTLAAAAVLSSITAATCAALAQEQVPPETNAQAKVLAQICGTDLTWFCPGVVPGGGRILVCL